MRALKALCIVAVALIVMIVGALLYVDNHTPIILRLLGAQSPPLPVFLWLYAAFVIGTVTGFALCLFGFVRGKLELRRVQRALRDQERELNHLRDSSAPTNVSGTHDAASANSGV